MSDAPTATPPDDDAARWFEYEDDGDMCPVCGGDGFIMASDGDPSDWGEDTYCGDDDAVIKCRHCNGGVIP